MKQLSILFLFGFLAMFLTACDKDDKPDDVAKKGSEFVFIYDPLNDSPYGANKGFFKVTANNGETQIQRLNDFYSNALSYSVNEKGRVLFTPDPRVVPADAPKNTQLAYFDIANPSQVKFVAPPEKPKDWHWVVRTAQQPILLKDGRIVATLLLEPDIYGSSARFHMGVYNPEENSWQISLDIAGFILSQPEKGSDTESGIIPTASPQVLSSDDSKVYITTQGFGVDGGVNHYDETFIAAYNIKRNEFERVMHGKNVLAAASNNSVLFIQDGKFKTVDLNTQNIIDVADKLSDSYTGAKNKDEFIITWRGSGLATFTRVGNAYEKKHIINIDKLTERKYRGLGSRAYYTNNENEIVFSATTDLYTNYAAELVLYKTPLIAENPDPELLLTLPKNFSAHFKMVK